MRQDLDTLKGEIQEALDELTFVTFHGFPRINESFPAAYWDCDRFPDFRMFLGTARQVDVKMVTFYCRQFSASFLDDAVDRLEAADLLRDEKRDLERRLRDLRVYEGFTCSIELTYDYHGRIYVYGMRTDWYEELLDILDQLDSVYPEDEEDDESGSLGGYFSRN